MAVIHKIQCVYFSPTGTTRKVLNTISENIGVHVASPIDLTLPKRRNYWKGEIESDLLLVGVPVYFGTIPSIIREPLRMLRGEEKWAVPIAVYGNVQTKQCLEELCGILRNQGFRILAAATFIGEHSFTHDELLIAAGRPDAKDLRVAADFGSKIAEKIGSGLREIPMECKAITLENQEERTHSIARVSEFNEEMCIRCQRCFEFCPVGSIDEDTLTVDDDSCIRCFACVRVCPTGVRMIVLAPSILARIHAGELDNYITIRREPEFFL